jgi:hypothetical protein
MPSIFAILAGAAAFCFVLPLLTLSTAWLADVTGRFQQLFISKPASSGFRLLRWGIALAAAVAVAASIE